MRAFKIACWLAIAISVLFILGQNSFVLFMFLSALLVLIPCLLILYLLVRFIAWAARR
jgi:hypothetical protein